MFRRIAMLLAITTVLLLAVIALTSLSTARAQDDHQQWQYALMVTFVIDKNFNAVAVAPDASETDDLTAALKDLSKLNLLTSLNVMGDAGWEMVSVQTESGVSTYVFKRPGE